MNIANQRLFILYTSQQKALNAIGSKIFKYSMETKERQHIYIVIESPMWTKKNSYRVWF